MGPTRFMSFLLAGPELAPHSPGSGRAFSWHIAPVLQCVLVVFGRDFLDEARALIARALERFHRPPLELGEQPLRAAFTVHVTSFG